MRILLTVPCYWPAVSYGGPVRKARDLAESLATRRNQVTVLTSNLAGLRSRLSTGTVRRSVGPVDVVYLSSPVRYRWNPVCPEALPWLQRNLRRYDVVHVMGYRDSIGLAAAAAARLARTPLVFEPLGMLLPAARSLRLKAAHDATLGRILPRTAAVVVATSSRERDQLAALGIEPERIAVRPNGIGRDLATLPPRGALRRRLGISEGAMVVLALGRISRQKGLPLLARAVAQTGEGHLLVAGPDDDDGGLDELRRAAASVGLDERLHLAGVLDRAGVLQAFADADAFAQVSSGESFGNAAAEAVAAGLPVVLTDAVGAADVLDGAAVVVPREPAAVARGLLRILFDDATRERLAAARPAVVERLAWPVLAQRQEAIYTAALEARR